MKPKDYKIAKELKERLSKVLHLIDFRVFGSRARGDEDEYSDMDVFIEVETLDKNLKEKIGDITWEIGFQHLIVICPLIFTRDEIEKSPMKASPIVKNISGNCQKQYERNMKAWREKNSRQINFIG